MPAITTTIFAQKGGVGKTTTTHCLAAAMAEGGNRVLLIDTDDSGDLGGSVTSPELIDGLNKANTTAALFDGQLDPQPDQLIQETPIDNVWLVASNAAISQYKQPNRLVDFALRDFVEIVTEAFDFILIDTPPELDTQSTWSSLLAADALILCVQLESYSANSLRRAEKMITAARRGGNPMLRLLGLLPCMADKRSKLHQNYEQELRSLYSEDVFETVMKRLLAFPESQHAQQTVLKYAPDSSAAQLVRSLANEVTTRLKAA